LHAKARGLLSKRGEVLIGERNAERSGHTTMVERTQAVDQVALQGHRVLTRTQAIDD
jgi:hypothetical protein